MVYLPEECHCKNKKQSHVVCGTSKGGTEWRIKREKWEKSKITCEIVKCKTQSNTKMKVFCEAANK